MTTSQVRQHHHQQHQQQQQQKQKTYTNLTNLIDVNNTAIIIKNLQNLQNSSMSMILISWPKMIKCQTTLVKKKNLSFFEPFYQLNIVQIEKKNFEIFFF